MLHASLVTYLLKVAHTKKKNLTKDSPMHATSLETGLDKKILDYLLYYS